MSSDTKIITQHLIDFMRITDVESKSKSIEYEYQMYVYCTKYLDTMKGQQALSRLRLFLSKIIALIRSFALSKGLNDERTHQILCEMYLVSDGLSTGAVMAKWENIEAIVSEGNVREVFYLIDEFLHQGCEVMNWFLYETNCLENKLDLNGEYIKSKIEKNASNIGIDVSKFSFKDLQSEVLNHLRKSNINRRSLCQLWNNKVNSNRTNRLQSMVEYARHVPFINHSEAFCLRTLDDKLFMRPNICDDLIRSRRIGTDFPVFTRDLLTSPVLSAREEEWCRNKNTNFDFDQIIPWRSGCCLYQPLGSDSIIGRISELYVGANRVTSQSGHTIINLDLFSLLDKDFDEWKKSYVVLIMASMIPYGHHSAHEILSSASYYGIEYDLTLDIDEQIKLLD